MTRLELPLCALMIGSVYASGGQEVTKKHLRFRSNDSTRSFHSNLDIPNVYKKRGNVNTFTSAMRDGYEAPPNSRTSEVWTPDGSPRTRPSSSDMSLRSELSSNSSNRSANGSIQSQTSPERPRRDSCSSFASYAPLMEGNGPIHPDVAVDLSQIPENQPTDWDMCSTAESEPEPSTVSRVWDIMRDEVIERTDPDSLTNKLKRGKRPAAFSYPGTSTIGSPKRNRSSKVKCTSSNKIRSAIDRLSAIPKQPSRESRRIRAPQPAQRPGPSTIGGKHTKAFRGNPSNASALKLLWSKGNQDGKGRRHSHPTIVAPEEAHALRN